MVVENKGAELEELVSNHTPRAKEHALQVREQVQVASGGAGPEEGSELIEVTAEEQQFLQQFENLSPEQQTQFLLQVKTIQDQTSRQQVQAAKELEKQKLLELKAPYDELEKKLADERKRVTSSLDEKREIRQARTKDRKFHSAQNKADAARVVKNVVTAPTSFAVGVLEFLQKQSEINRVRADYRLFILMFKIAEGALKLLPNLLISIEERTMRKYATGDQNIQMDKDKAARKAKKSGKDSSGPSRAQVAARKQAEDHKRAEANAKKAAQGRGASDSTGGVGR